MKLHPLLFYAVEPNCPTDYSSEIAKNSQRKTAANYFIEQLKTRQRIASIILLDIKNLSFKKAH